MVHDVNRSQASSYAFPKTESSSHEATAFVLEQQRDEAAKQEAVVEEDTKAGSLEEQVQELQSIVSVKGWYLNISKDHELGQTIVKLLDKDSGDVIRQIPNEELLSISKRFRELEQPGSDESDHKGLLFDKLV